MSFVWVSPSCEEMETSDKFQMKKICLHRIRRVFNSYTMSAFNKTNTNDISWMCEFDYVWVCSCKVLQTIIDNIYIGKKKSRFCLIVSANTHLAISISYIHCTLCVLVLFNAEVVSELKTHPVDCQRGRVV